MMRITSNNTKFHATALSSCAAFLFVVLQPTSFNLAAAQSDDNTVEFMSNIEMMKGHLEQAVANKKTGNDTLTLAHVLHPIAELYDLIEVKLATADSNLNNTLATSLSELSKNVEKLDSSQFTSETDKVNEILDKVNKLIVPADNSTLNLVVVSNLLDTANSEYEEGVQDGAIKEIIEYQDARGFISRADSLFNRTSSMLNQSMKTEGDEVMSLFPSLNEKVESKSNITDIETSINGIKQGISEITGITTAQLGSVTEDSDNKSIARIKEIRDLLTQVMSKHKAQNYAKAEELATKAYLDNFEFIEADLGKQDQKLMEDTEVLLRQELRQAIKDKKSIDEIQLLLDKINLNLDNAEKLLS